MKTLDELFCAAVSAIDAGDVVEVERLVSAHPALVRDRLEAPGAWLRDRVGDALDGFFQKPYLLWFVAEDPVRTGTLPANIADITRTVIRAAERAGVETLPEQLDYALRLRTHHTSTTCHEPPSPDLTHYQPVEDSAMIPARRRVSTERPGRFLTGGLVVTMGFIVSISSASAQNARQTDVAVAYVTAGYLGYDYSVHGWNVQLSAQKTRRWTLVGEFGYEREGPHHRGWAGLSGGRFGWRPASRASPFWQILAGGLHETGVGSRKDTINSLAVQPGGGMTLTVTPRFGVRIQADLRLGISSEVSGLSRVLAGGVMRLGNEDVWNRPEGLAELSHRPAPQCDQEWRR